MSYTESDTLNAFQSGGAAFMRYWSSGFRAINKAMAGTAGIALLPAGPGGQAQTIGGFQLAVSGISPPARGCCSRSISGWGGDTKATSPAPRILANSNRSLRGCGACKCASSTQAATHCDAGELGGSPSTVSRDKYGEVSKGILPGGAYVFWREKLKSALRLRRWSKSWSRSLAIRNLVATSV